MGWLSRKPQSVCVMERNNLKRIPKVPCWIRGFREIYSRTQFFHFLVYFNFYFRRCAMFMFIEKFPESSVAFFSHGHDNPMRSGNSTQTTLLSLRHLLTWSSSPGYIWDRSRDWNILLAEWSISTAQTLSWTASNASTSWLWPKGWAGQGNHRVMRSVELQHLSSTLNLKRLTWCDLL